MALTNNTAPIISERERALVKGILAAGLNTGIAIRSDGRTVSRLVDQFDLKDQKYVRATNWEFVQSVAAGNKSLVGLRYDGVVLYSGPRDLGQGDVSQWRDVVEVAASGRTTFGVTKDGHVLATGEGVEKGGRCDVSQWRDIISVKAAAHTVGLRRDGTVVAIGNPAFYMPPQWPRRLGVTEISQWTDIVEIAVGAAHTVGLRKDGTVVATGMDECGETDVWNWRGIIAIAAGYQYTAGLKADGTMVAVGRRASEQCGYKDVIAISGGWLDVAVLKKDGRVLGCGILDRLFENLEKLADDRHRMFWKLTQIVKRQKEIDTLEEQCGTLGFFAMSDKKAIRKKIAALNEEIRQISQGNFGYISK